MTIEDKINTSKDIVSLLILFSYIAMSFMIMLEASKTAFLIISCVYFANSMETITVTYLISKNKLIKKNIFWVISAFLSNIGAFVVLGVIHFHYAEVFHQ